MMTNATQTPTDLDGSTKPAVEIDETALDQVSGGPAYMKLGDIKGESTSSASSPTRTQTVIR